MEVERLHDHIHYSISLDKAKMSRAAHDPLGEISNNNIIKNFDQKWMYNESN